MNLRPYHYISQQSRHSTAKQTHLGHNNALYEPEHSGLIYSIHLKPSPPTKVKIKTPATQRQCPSNTTIHANQQQHNENSLPASDNIYKQPPPSLLGGQKKTPCNAAVTTQRNFSLLHPYALATPTQQLLAKSPCFFLRSGSEVSHHPITSPFKKGGKTHPSLSTTSSPSSTLPPAPPFKLGPTLAARLRMCPPNGATCVRCLLRL